MSASCSKTFLWLKTGDEKPEMEQQNKGAGWRTGLWALSEIS